MICLDVRMQRNEGKKSKDREWKRTMGKMGIFIHLKEDLEDPMKIPDFLPPSQNFKNRMKV
jgi:hypothetical protein